MEAMSHDTVERILGRILTDSKFRERFFRRPQRELEQLDLLAHERESLGSLERVQLLVELLAEKLDPRIVRE
jgi:hypothetical protein